MINNCPICKSKYILNESFAFCTHCRYKIANEVYEKLEYSESIKRINNCVFSWVIKHRDYIGDQTYFFYYYDPFVDDKNSNQNNEDNTNMINLWNELKVYPKTLLTRIDEILINIVSIYNDMGEFFAISPSDESLMFCETANVDSEIAYLLSMMAKLDYIIYEEDSLDDSVYRCQITLAGWRHIEEIKNEKKDINQAFIAMKFGDVTEYIATSFKKAIVLAGYIPYKMDEIEHNNQIVPEMLFEISRSKMLIIDVTVPNLGAYYEAGYAQALGKEVIVCCKKSELEKAHFDISQKNMIIWETENELVTKLTKRIEATVGKNE